MYKYNLESSSLDIIIMMGVVNILFYICCFFQWIACLCLINRRLCSFYFPQRNMLRLIGRFSSYFFNTSCNIVEVRNACFLLKGKHYQVTCEVIQKLLITFPLFAWFHQKRHIYIKSTSRNTFINEVFMKIEFKHIKTYGGRYSLLGGK